MTSRDVDEDRSLAPTSAPKDLETAHLVIDLLGDRQRRRAFGELTAAEAAGQLALQRGHARSQGLSREQRLDDDDAARVHLHSGFRPGQWLETATTRACIATAFAFIFVLTYGMPLFGFFKVDIPGIDAAVALEAIPETLGALFGLAAFFFTALSGATWWSAVERRRKLLAWAAGREGQLARGLPRLPSATESHGAAITFASLSVPGCLLGMLVGFVGEDDGLWPILGWASLAGIPICVVIIVWQALARRGAPTRHRALAALHG